MLLYPFWQEIKNKTKTFSRTLFIWEGADAGRFLRKQSTLSFFTNSHVRWFVLKSSIRHFNYYIYPLIAANRDAPFHALAWEVTEESGCKKQFVICWGREREMKREGRNNRRHALFGSHADVFAGSIQQNCIFNVLQKSKYIFFICVFLITYRFLWIIFIFLTFHFKCKFFVLA